MIKKAATLGVFAPLAAAGLTILAVLSLSPHGGGVSAIHYPCHPPPEAGAPGGEPAEFWYVNDTTETASDLCVVYAGSGGTLNSLQIIEQPEACPAIDGHQIISGSTTNGPIAVAGDNRVYIDWGVPCVDPGEEVIITVFSSAGPLTEVEVLWTLGGEPIASPTPTLTPTPTPTASPTPMEPTPTASATATPSGSPGPSPEFGAVFAGVDLRHLPANVYRQGDDVWIVVPRTQQVAFGQPRLVGPLDDVVPVDFITLDLTSFPALEIVKEYYGLPQQTELDIYSFDLPVDAGIGEYIFELPFGDEKLVVEFKVVFNVEKPDGWTKEEFEQWKRGNRERLYTSLTEHRDVTLDIFNETYNMEIKEIEKGVKKISEAAKKKREWVTNNTTYGHNGAYGNDYCYPDIKTFMKKLWERFEDNTKPFAQGECSDNCMVLVAKLRAQNIPARAISGLGTFRYNYHCWVEFWDGDEWQSMDSTPGLVQDPQDPDDFWDENTSGGSPVTQDPNNPGGNPLDLSDEYAPPGGGGSSISGGAECLVEITPTVEGAPYQFGETINANVRFSNNAGSAQSVETTIAVINTEPEGLFGIQSDRRTVFEQMETIDLPGGGAADRPVSLVSAEYLDSGKFALMASAGEGCSETLFFDVAGGLGVSVSLPATADVGETFDIEVSVANQMGVTVNNISLGLATPTYSSLPFTTEGLGSLTPGGETAITYEASISRCGPWTFAAHVDGDESSGSTAFGHIEVPCGPLLDVEAASEGAQSASAGMSRIRGLISNLGDRPLGPTEVVLHLPDGLATGDPQTVQLAGLAPGETVELVWEATAEATGPYTYAITAIDASGEHRDIEFARLLAGAGPALTQGDVDCDGDTDTVDALGLLRYVAALEVAQEPGCPEIGSEVASQFGDVDCNDDVDVVDALQVLRHVAGLPVAQQDPCPDIGEPLTGGAAGLSRRAAVAALLAAAGVAVGGSLVVRRERRYPAEVDRRSGY